MRKSILLAGIGIIAGFCGIGNSYADGKILYEETFNNYALKPVGFSESCAIGEYPPSLKHMEFRPKKQESVYLDFGKGLKKENSWQNYEMEFKFRFPGGSKKTFDLLLRSGKNTTHTLHISPDESGISEINGFTPKTKPAKIKMSDLGIAYFLGDVWYNGIVQVNGKNLDFYIVASGQVKKITSCEMSGEPCTGFNFSGESPVDFDDIIVRELAGNPAAPASPLRIPTLEPDGSDTKIFSAAGEQKLDFPEGGGMASASLRLGDPKNEIKIKLSWSDNSENIISVKSGFETWGKRAIREDKPVTDQMKMEDGLLDFAETGANGKAAPGGWKLRAYIRPNIIYYEEGIVAGVPSSDRTGIMANWDKFPAASAQFFRFEIRPDEKGAEIWVNRRYAGHIDKQAKPKSLTFSLPSGGAIKAIAAGAAPEKSAFLPLDVAAVANPGLMKEAKLSVKPGEQKIKNIPFTLAEAKNNVDIGVVDEHLGTFWLECDGYLGRHAFTGIPDALLVSVPQAQYCRAWVICAMEDDPAKDPILTARLTRFPAGDLGGMGPAIADTSVTLPRPGEAAKNGITEIGKIEYSKDGKAVSVPLYLVEIPIKLGDIQDLFQLKEYKIINKPYLDFELLGKLDIVKQQLDKSHKPDPASKSGVHVFGVTLEKSPVEMELSSAISGNTYMPGEKAEMSAKLRANAKGDCKVQWEIRDIDGKNVGNGRDKASFEKEGEEKQIAIPLAQKEFGWYGITIKLFDAKERLLNEHNASFVMIDKDARKADYDSPYFSWFFGGAHGTGKLSDAGPLLARTGVHLSLLKNETEGAPWKLTLAQIGSQNISLAKPEEEIRKKFFADVDKIRANFPHVKAADIYHETYNGPFPLELLDMPTPEIPETQAKLEGNLVKNAEMMCKLYREKYPDIKLVVGNCGDSLGTMAMFFRNKFPKDYIDYMGEESVAQTIPPEKSTAINNWMLNELAKKFDYPAKPEACYEWKYRNVRDFGGKNAAQWVIRDAMIGYAWNQKLIPVPGLISPANSYYNTIWGNCYMYNRYPMLYPNPSAAAVATMTQVLDCAKFKRMIPTNSLTVYALEFTRDNEFIYALWAARGAAEASLEFAADAKLKHTALFGNGKELKTEGKKLKLGVDTSVCYLTSTTQLNAVSTGKRSYPSDALPAGAKFVLGSPMDKVADWSLVSGVDPRIDNPPKHGNYLPFRKTGKFELRQVKDEEKGDCVELELVKEGKSPAIMQEYTFMKLAKPVEISGKPNTVGVWVKGNSGWGQLMWEFEDAEGEKWFSAGTGGYGCDVYDWPGQAAINFEGWNLVQFPMTQESPVRFANPGEVLNQWQSSGGNRKIDYPVKLTGLGVSMTRQALNLTEMKDIKPVLRFKDLGAYGN